MTDTIVLPLAGGALIGVAAAAMMILNGRIAGISGILGGVVDKAQRPEGWRVSFLLGLLAGGALYALIDPSAFPTIGTAGRPLATLIIAGLVVGFGTRMGGGCTSGHGVCGIGRLSPRSIVATIVFISTGALAVVAARALELG